MSRVVTAALLALSLVAVACGGSPMGPSEVDISGTWSGFSAARSTTYTMSIATNHSTITGTWDDGFSHGGTVTGTRNGTSVNVTLNGGGGTCSLTITGTLTTNTSLSGTVAGINCVSNTGGPIVMVKR